MQHGKAPGGGQVVENRQNRNSLFGSQPLEFWVLVLSAVFMLAVLIIGPVLGMFEYTPRTQETSQNTHDVQVGDDGHVTSTVIPSIGPASTSPVTPTLASSPTPLQTPTPMPSATQTATVVPTRSTKQEYVIPFNRTRFLEGGGQKSPGFGISMLLLRGCEEFENVHVTLSDSAGNLIEATRFPPCGLGIHGAMELTPPLTLQMQHSIEEPREGTVLLQVTSETVSFASVR